MPSNIREFTVHSKTYKFDEETLKYFNIINDYEKKLITLFEILNELSKENFRNKHNQLIEQCNSYINDIIVELAESGIYNKTIDEYTQNNQGYIKLQEILIGYLEYSCELELDALNNVTYGAEYLKNKAESKITGSAISGVIGDPINILAYGIDDYLSSVRQAKKASVWLANEVNNLNQSQDDKIDSKLNEYLVDEYDNILKACDNFINILLNEYLNDLKQLGKLNEGVINKYDKLKSDKILKNVEIVKDKIQPILIAIEEYPLNIKVYKCAYDNGFLNKEFLELIKFLKIDKELYVYIMNDITDKLSAEISLTDWYINNKKSIELLKKLNNSEYSDKKIVEYYRGVLEDNINKTTEKLIADITNNKVDYANISEHININNIYDFQKNFDNTFLEFIKNKYNSIDENNNDNIEVIVNEYIINNSQKNAKHEIENNNSSNGFKYL